MKFDGALYNPDYSGEGIFLTEESDGTVIGGFFSYDDAGKPMWIVVSGKRTGAVVVLEAITASGGKMGDKAALKNVVEKPWGSIVIEDVGTKLHLTFEPIDRPIWNYQVQPIHQPGVQPPAPTPEPEPEPPPIVIPAGLKLETKTRWQPSFRERIMPYLGSSNPIPAEAVTGVYQFNTWVVINNGDAPVLIKPSKMVGPNNPKISGISAAGKMLQPGGYSLTAVCSIGPLTVTKPGDVVRSDYGLHLADDAKIVGCTAQVEYPN